MAAAQGYAVKLITAKQMIHKAAFVKGFKDAKAGRPFEYDAFATIFEAEMYERGRHFACVFDEPIKFGKQVSLKAQFALNDAFDENYVL